MAAKDIKRWSVGRVTVTRIVERSPFDIPVAALFQDETEELLRPFEWLRPHFVSPEGRLLIAFQCFVVEASGRRMVVDTCIGNDRVRRYAVFNDMRTAFLDDMLAAGFPPDTIDTVMCTHLHFDHVGWNTRLENGRWVPTFPNARYLFARLDWENICRQRAAGDPRAQHYPDSLEPIAAAGLADFIEPGGHTVCDEVWLEPTPGHTPGHVCVHISSQGAEAIITGDIMHSPLQCAFPEKESAFDEDRSLACCTRRSFLSRCCDRGTLLFGTHFPEPTAGYIRRNESNWRFGDAVG
jgi:glyoxylase-like metal-dependent hydrolase (beta-lactamase superfamily II)